MRPWPVRPSLVAARQARSAASAGEWLPLELILLAVTLHCATGWLYLTFIWRAGILCLRYTMRLQWEQSALCAGVAGADVAQSAEHRPCKSRVAGSIPAVGL